MSGMDEVLGILALAGSERASQAKYDASVRRGERRAYAKLLREIIALIDEPRPDRWEQAREEAMRRMSALIADLESDDAAISEHYEDKAYAERRDGGFSAPDTDL